MIEEYSCVMKPQRKHKLRSSRAREEIYVPGWAVCLKGGRRLFPKPFFVDLEFRWSDFGFGASVLDEIGAERAASAASRAGYIVFQMRSVAPSPHFT